MEEQRRSFIKKLIQLGLFVIFPFKSNATSTDPLCETTTNDIEGPFYISDSPNINILTPPEITSNFLFITGTVYANDCITPIPNAVIDVWHADKGDYDSTTDTYLNSSYNDSFYRAKIYTDNNGNYAYKTILPGKYLNGNYYRPSHIHYKSSYLNQNELTTQLYFKNDSSITIDPWASDVSAEERIIELNTDQNNDLNGVFDITLNTDPSTIQNTILTENSIIKSIYPNPINHTTKIYLNKNCLQFIIEICNINGEQINRIATTQKIISLSKIMQSNMKAGIYIIKVTSNEGVVNAKRFSIINTKS